MAAFRDLRRTIHGMTLRHAVLLWIPGIAALGLLWLMTRDPKAGGSRHAQPAPAARTAPAKESQSTPSPLDSTALTAAPTTLGEPPSDRTIITATPRVPSPVPAGTPGLASEAAPPPLERGKPMDIQPQLDGVNLMLRDFRSITGENPVGTNAEIMKALMGGNPRQATLGPPPGQRLNADGELLDPWGKPYFFHQLSARETEIRSAGPDGQMWTDDDQTMTSGTGAAPRPPQ